MGMSSEPTPFPGVSTKPYRLLEQVDASMRLRHYSGSTIKAYSSGYGGSSTFTFTTNAIPRRWVNPR